MSKHKSLQLIYHPASSASLDDAGGIVQPLVCDAEQFEV